MTPFDVYAPEHLLLFCLAAALAGFIRGFAGFAGPAIVSLLLAHFFVPATLLPRIILLDFYAYPMLLRSVRHGADWKLSIPMAVATIALLPFGLEIMQTVEPATLKRMIGIACLAAIAVSLTGFRFRRLPPWWVNVPVAGALGLVLSSTFIALPLVTYFFMLPLSAVACRATVLSFTVMVIPCMAFWVFSSGLVQLEDVLPVALAGALYFAMIYLGSRAFERSGGAHYRQVVQWLLVLLSGAVMF
ncbi:MAG: sulfite exporter TauE/SafE family protein [Pseudomonadota bacterium]